MNIQQQRTLLNAANSLLNKIEGETDVIETQKRYAANEKWQGLYPRRVLEAAFNEIQAKEKRTLLKVSYLAIIKEIKDKF